MILGPLEIIDGERRIALSAPKPSRILSLLLLNHGQVVATRTLMKELWGDNPPISASTTLQTYIYQLRKLLVTSRSHDSQVLQTHSSGYCLQIASGSFDLDAFTKLVSQGQRELTRGEHAKARTSLTEALKLWRGQALAGLELGPQLQARVTGLEELRQRALEMRIEASLAAGLHQETIGELRLLTTAEPYREGLAAQLMLALYRSERRSEALEVYRRLRMLLIDELGIEPSPRVRKLHEAILNNDASIDFQPQPQAASVPARPETSIKPAQLPPDTPDFAGRTKEVAHVISALLPSSASTRYAPPRVIITGMAGVGKSALAVHAAHALRSHYPDGQLYVQLRRRSGPVSPEAALAAMLQAVGVPHDSIPMDLEGRSQLFRSWVADRRLLVLIDNATSVDQVRPMLPTGPHSAVLITSQMSIGGLGGAETITLSPMNMEEGKHLLTLLVGDCKAAMEPDVARALVQICGGLPLAIRVCAARLTRRGWSLGQMLVRLADENERLNELCTDGLDVRSSLERGLSLLTREESLAFQRLGTMKADTFTTTYAACELMSSVRDTERLLDRMHEASLIQLLGEDRGGEPLWHFHPLLCVYAAEMERGQYVDVRCSVA